MTENATTFLFIHKHLTFLLKNVLIDLHLIISLMTNSKKYGEIE